MQSFFARFEKFGAAAVALAVSAVFIATAIVPAETAGTLSGMVA